MSKSPLMAKAQVSPNNQKSVMLGSSIPTNFNSNDQFYEHRLHNLEFNLNEDDTFSWPLYCRKSRIFNGKTVFHLESYRQLNELNNRLKEWFNANPNMNQREFQALEDKLNLNQESQTSYYGHLLIPIFKRCVCRIDVKVFGQIARLAGLEDYYALKDILDMVFENKFGNTIIAIDTATGSQMQPLPGQVSGGSVISEFQPLPGQKGSPNQNNQNEMNRKFQQLLDVWKNDEKNYQEKEDSGKFFGNEKYKHLNPGLRDEAMKLLRMEDMLNEDYQKVREDMFLTNLGLVKRNKELLDQNGDINAKLNPNDNERIKAMEKDNLRLNMELKLLKNELEREKANNADYDTRHGKLQAELEASRLRVVELENMKPPEPPSRILPCFSANLVRTQVVVKTHSTDLLAVCKRFKQFIIDGIKNDFQTINSGSSDDYEKSMIIREHLNKKDNSIKRIDELIRLVTALYDDASNPSYSGPVLENKLLSWNQDYNRHTDTYKDIVKEYEKIFGRVSFSDDFEEEVKTAKFETEFISGAQGRLLDKSEFFPQRDTFGAPPPVLQPGQLADGYHNDVPLEPFELKCWKNHQPLRLLYTGEIKGGKKVGPGKLTWVSSKTPFYEGNFVNDEMCAKNFKLMGHSGNPMVVVNGMTQEKPLSQHNGPVLLYHSNGQLAYTGNLQNGLKDGDGEEYYKNGNLKFKGPFKEGGYHGEHLTVYNSHLEKNIMLKGNFHKGTLDGKVDRIWFRDNEKYNGNRFVIDAHFKDGLMEGESVIHLNPTGGFYYKGAYKAGKKEGHGTLFCDDTGKELFKGEWRNNLPYKNDGSSSNVVTINHLKGKKMFEGTLDMAEDGWIEGNCILYHYHDGSKVFYEGKYRAPTLSAVIFCTWDMELENYTPFLPKF